VLVKIKEGKMDKEQLQSEINRLRRELYELRVEYKELLRKYRKVSDELLLLKEGNYEIKS
jgi:hypothetical protein